MATILYPIGGEGNYTGPDHGVNTIPNGLPAIVMRESMENKNLLSQKGAIYAGTGETQQTITEGGNTYTIAKTAAVPPPDGMNKILGSVTDNTSATGLGWINLENLGIKSKWGTVSSSSSNSGIGTWSGTSAPFVYTIPFSAHGLSSSFIWVQLMMETGGPPVYEIVNATVTIDMSYTIKIQSNIKWNGVVLLATFAHG